MASVCNACRKGRLACVPQDGNRNRIACAVCYKAKIKCSFVEAARIPTPTAQTGVPDPDFRLSAKRIEKENARMQQEIDILTRFILHMLPTDTDNNSGEQLEYTQRTFRRAMRRAKQGHAPRVNIAGMENVKAESNAGSEQMSETGADGEDIYEPWGGIRAEVTDVEMPGVGARPRADPSEDDDDDDVEQEQLEPVRSRKARKPTKGAKGVIVPVPSASKRQTVKIREKKRQKAKKAARSQLGTIKIIISPDSGLRGRVY